MNERIKELILESGFPVFGKMYVVSDGEELNKFSQLIVKECVQICKTVGSDQVSNASKDYQKGREMGTEVCCNMIKKHFGVE